MKEHTKLFTQNPMLKILFLAALLFDTISTIYFIGIEGTSNEIHPLVRFSVLVWDPVLGTFLSAFAFKAVASFLLEAMYFKQYAVYLYATVICTSTLAGCFNFLTMTTI